MKSYKNWQLVQESTLPGRSLGVTNPQILGGLRSNVPGVSLSEKKKMHGDVVVDDVADDDDKEECHCKGKKKKPKKAFSKCGKMMKKKMEDDVKNIMKKKKGVEDDFKDDVEDHDDHEEDDDVEDHDDHEEDDDAEDHDDHEEDDDVEDHDEEEEEEDGEDSPKFGFMKDKKCNKKKPAKKKKMVDEWNGSENEETQEDFYASLSRQFGTPGKRHHGGVENVNEDLLLSPEQQALIDAMPKPGEVGYAPQGRLGFSSMEEEPDYAAYEESADIVKESTDYKVLRKYFTKEVARKLIKKKK